MHKIYLLLGSNLGNKLKILTQACSLIENNIGKILTQSQIYETAAWGKTNQPSFYNQVILIESSFSPEDTLLQTQAIENELGRQRIEKWGARTLDIDILYFDDFVINTSSLTIPHPEIANRKFTLIPLVEIAHGFINPTLNKTNNQLLQECADKLDVIAITL